MDIKIREAEINDYEDLCEIYVELDEQHRLNHPELFKKPEDYGRAKEYISEIINDGNKTLFVAVVDSIVVAFAECCIQKSTDFPVIKKREWVQLDGIAVKKEYQNYQIGSLLLSKVIGWAKSKKIVRVELKVYSFNNSADKFYSRKGFKDLSKVMYLDL
ncbi:GNAT family N-acetyltransferase [Desulfosporosinus sp. FKB]|uniref:GNAT family N-acetyltransferase n=1 Tax=Desulfosporosinus sp. FKB TaxID=1969835 RepID=UPI000B4972B5|nr:GNAT family N-acetyltransferase [Desulfosporosinus sp. FKB]